MPNAAAVNQTETEILDPQALQGMSDNERMAAVLDANDIETKQEESTETPEETKQALMAGADQIGKSLAEGGREVETKDEETEDELSDEAPDWAKRSLAVIGRREKKLAEDMQQFKKSREEDPDIRKELDEYKAGMQRLDEDIKKDPAAFLKKHGNISVEDFLNRVVKDGEPGHKELARRSGEDNDSKFDELSSKYDALVEKLDQRDKDDVVNGYRTDIDSAISADHKLLGALPGANERALAIAIDYLKENEETLTPVQAAERVDKEFRVFLSGLIEHDEARNVLAQMLSDKQNNGTSGQPTEKKGHRVPGTLTNSLAASRKSLSTMDLQDLSEEERMRVVLEQMG